MKYLQKLNSEEDFSKVEELVSSLEHYVCYIPSSNKFIVNTNELYLRLDSGKLDINKLK